MCKRAYGRDLALGRLARGQFKFMVSQLLKGREFETFMLNKIVTDAGIRSGASTQVIKAIEDYLRAPAIQAKALEKHLAMVERNKQAAEKKKNANT